MALMAAFKIEGFLHFQGHDINWKIISISVLNTPMNL